MRLGARVAAAAIAAAVVLSGLLLPQDGGGPLSTTATASNLRPADPPVVKGHYGGHILRGGRLDAAATVAALQHQGVNVHPYLISTAQQWADFPSFLRAVEGTGITVWAYLVPPASAPRPAGLKTKCHTSTYVNGGDYVSIFRSLGRLSQQFPALTAIVMDDFAQSAAENPKAKCRFFTVEMVANMRAAAQSKQPGLRFYPVLYHRDLVGSTLDLLRYRPYVDGAVFPYRGERLVGGRWEVNYHRRNTLEAQVRQADFVMNGSRRLFVMAYGIHRCPPSTPGQWKPGVCKADQAHLSALTRASLVHTARGNADGVVVYRYPLDDLTEPPLEALRRSW